MASISLVVAALAGCGACGLCLLLRAGGPLSRRAGIAFVGAFAVGLAFAVVRGEETAFERFATLAVLWPGLVAVTLVVVARDPRWNLAAYASLSAVAATAMLGESAPTAAGCTAAAAGLVLVFAWTTLGRAELDEQAAHEPVLACLAAALIGILLNVALVGTSGPRLLAGVLFAVGSAGLCARRDARVALLCVGAMAQGVAVLAVHFGRRHGNDGGEHLALTATAITAAIQLGGLSSERPARTKQASESTTTPSKSDSGAELRRPGCPA